MLRERYEELLCCYCVMLLQLQWTQQDNAFTVMFCFTLFFRSVCHQQDPGLLQCNGLSQGLLLLMVLICQGII